MADTDQALRDVLARLDSLEYDNAILKQQNGTLLARVNAQPTPADWTRDADGSPLERMSRRWVLRRGMQAAAATVAAGVLVQRDSHGASATHRDKTLYVDAVYAHLFFADQVVSVDTTNTVAAVLSTNHGTGPGVQGTAEGINGIGINGIGAIGVRGESSRASYYGVYGYNPNGTGVRGEGVTGLHGVSSTDWVGAVWGQHTGIMGYGVVGDGVGAGTAGILGRNTSGAGVRGEGAYGVVGDAAGATTAGILGRNSTGTGVRGEGAFGVYGTSTTPGFQGIYGTHSGTNEAAGYGVVGDAAGIATAGVLGRNNAGWGVRGEGATGVSGTSGVTDQVAVWGIHTGQGFGVIGDGHGASNVGVLGRNSTGDGVRGEGKTGVHGVSATGTGVSGEGAGAGYGGVFTATRAQIRLTPTGRIGRPTTGGHQIGELYLDKLGAIYVCTVAGTPGTWRKLSTTVA